MPTSSASEAGRPNPRLLFEDVDAGYGGAPIVTGATGRVGRGEIVTIVGPNGAGKSTLLKALVGMIPAMSGKVYLDGEEVTNFRANLLARRGLGYVPQVDDIFDTLTVSDNLAMGGYLLNKQALAARAEVVLDVFPALKRMLRRTASKLSGGERKMLAMARVLMLEPQVLALDEPTSNLSADLARVLLEEHVKRLGAAGAAVLLIEQKALAALAISDWAYVMAGGKIKISAPAAQLLSRSDIGDVFLGRESSQSGEPKASGMP